MNSKSVKAPSASNQSEIEMLKAKIAELEKNSKEVVTTHKEEIEDRKIQQDEYISVMSLLPYNLNLSTKEGGQGSTKKFTKFGEVKKILYKDLVEILEVHSNFLEAGYFYILDPTLIRHHGLDDTYSKILTKDKIEEILLANSDECITLYNSSNEKQQEIIVQLLVDKLKDAPGSLNLNMVDRISRISKVDIIKKAEESKELELELVEQ